MGTKALIFEIVGIDKASHTFEKVSAAVTASTTKMERLQRAGVVAGRALAIGLAGTAVVAYEATKAAGEDEASQARLAQQLKNTTGATDENIAKVNEWIEAQAKAKGNGVEPLRDAMSKLVTTTGSVDKAQRLLVTAQSVAAGTGKDLGAITLALVKAQNGSLSGLSRLGIATKDASGHTKTLSQVMQDLSTKYHGAAAKAADTTAGKQKILGVEIHELAVQIGTALIPAMTALVGVLIQIVQWTGNHTRAVGIALAAIGALLAVTWAIGLATKAFAAIQVIAGAASKAFAAAQWLVNVALDANPIGLVVIAIAALVAGLILAYRHSDTFRAIVDKTFSFIGKVVPKVIGEVVNFVKAHWLLLGTIIGGPLVLIVALVVKHFDTIKRVAIVAVGAVVDTAKDYGKFAKAVIDKVGDVVSFFKKLPGKITGFLSGLPGELATIGGQIIQGLVNGIQAAAHKVYDVVQSIIDKIPKKIRQIMGIASPSKVTEELGKNIGEGLAVGMERSSGKAEAAAKKLADKVKAQLSTLMSNLASTASGVAGNFTGSLYSASAQAAVLDENGNVVTPAQTVGQNFLSNLSSTSGQLSQLIPAFKTLKHWGWKPGMLAALFQAGGADLIIELASDKGEASQAQSLLGGIGGMSHHLGNLVGENQYGDQIAAAKNKLHGKGGKGGKGDGSERTGDTYNVTINGSLDGNDAAKKVVQAIKKYKREVEANRELGIA